MYKRNYTRSYHTDLSHLLMILNLTQILGNHLKLIIDISNIMKLLNNTFKNSMFIYISINLQKHFIYFMKIMQIYFYSSFFQIFMTIFVYDIYSCACDLDFFISQDIFKLRR